MTRRLVVLAAVLALQAILVGFLSYDTSYQTGDGVMVVEKVPLTIEQWTGTDLALDPIVYDILETRAILQRSYRSSLGRVLMSVVYYPETKVDFHAPESCLAGSGKTILKSTKTLRLGTQADGRSLEVTQLVSQEAGGSELAYYFYKAGKYMGGSYFGLRLNLIWNKVKMSNPSGALIRVSTSLDAANPDVADSVLRDFLTKLYPYLASSL